MRRRRGSLNLMICEVCIGKWYHSVPNDRPPFLLVEPGRFNMGAPLRQSNYKQPGERTEKYRVLIIEELVSRLGQDSIHQATVGTDIALFATNSYIWIMHYIWIMPVNTSLKNANSDLSGENVWETPLGVSISTSLQTMWVGGLGGTRTRLVSVPYCEENRRLGGVRGVCCTGLSVSSTINSVLH